MFVGSSSDVKKSLGRHKYRVKRGRHYNTGLLNDMTTLGMANFTASMLEVITLPVGDPYNMARPHRRILRTAENKWIRNLRSNDPAFGYNRKRVKLLELE